MTLNRVGFFRELRHGDPSSASLQESQGLIPDAIVKSATKYLRSGAILAATGQLVSDWFNTATIIGPLELYTDGSWIWPSDLPFYVEHYRVQLPTDFVVWMASNTWQCPQLSDAELVKVEAELFAADDKKEAK